MFKESITFRQITLADVEGIFELEKLWETEQVSFIFEPFTREEFISNLKKFPNYHLVALSNNQIIGYINGIIKNKDAERVFKKNENYLIIENIFVKSEYRNKQIGGKLLDKIIQNAKNNGITKYAVATDTKDMKSILHFYESKGFKPFYVQLFKIDEDDH